jgi:transcriptional regulator with XRE-family HTH domain
MNNTPTPIPFCDHLKSALESSGLTQRELATEFGVAESTVSRWVSGASVPHPRIQALVLSLLCP